MLLSVCIITRNEEENLPRCLASVSGLADQVVVVDSLSTDGTVRLARQAGAEVISQEFLGHVRQKQLALEHARGEWVLCLDADEWLDEELREAVRREIASPGAPAARGFEVNRRTWYLGDWIDHGGWSPQWRVRLVRRDRAAWTGSDPHDRLNVDGPVGRLSGRLCHRPYRSLSEHLGKINRYTDIMNQQIASRGRQASLVRMLLRPPGRFVRMFLLRAGFLDGWRGFVLAVMGAFYVFLKHAKPWVRQARTDREPQPGGR